MGLPAQFVRYFSFSGWFFRDALLRYRARLALLTAANVAGVALQALAVLLAYQYARAVEAGRAIELAGMAVDPRGSFALLAGTAVGALLLAVTAAVLVARSRVEGARLGLDYADFCANRVYLLVSQASSAPPAGPADDYTMERFLELARRDARYGGQVLRIVIYGLIHVGTVVVAGVALIVLDAALTLAVFGIMLVAATFLRRTSIRAASHRARVQQHSPHMARERRAVEDRVLRNPASLSIPDARLDSARHEGAMRRVRDAVLGQRETLETGKLIAQVAIGCALFVVLLVQGSATLSRASDWSALLVYIAALSFFGNSLARVGRMLVSINRYYPPLARHARFVEAARTSPAPAIDRGPYRLDAPTLEEGAQARLELRPGSRVALILPGEMTRYTMLALAGALRAPQDAGEAGIALPWFAGSLAGVGWASLREGLGLPRTCSRADLAEALASLRPPEGFVALPESLDSPLSEAGRRALGPNALFVLLALSGILNRRAILALEQVALASLPAQMDERLLSAAAGAALLIAYRVNQAPLVQHQESAVIISGREEVFGWTSAEAFARGGGEISRALSRAATEFRSAQLAGVDEEELDEL